MSNKFIYLFNLPYKLKVTLAILMVVLIKMQVFCQHASLKCR